jgi:GNAT superfamily N-acetyltransferase
MANTVRTLRQEEGQLLKELFIRMTTETPTAYRGRLAELEQNTDADWQGMAEHVATSPNMDAFVAENEVQTCGFVSGTIVTEELLAIIEGRKAGDNGEMLTDTTLLGRMWVAPHARSQGLGQALIQAILSWAIEKKQRRVMLAITEGNERALRCYTRANFVPTGFSMPHASYPELTIHFMEYLL